MTIKDLPEQVRKLLVKVNVEEGDVKEIEPRFKEGAVVVRTATKSYLFAHQNGWQHKSTDVIKQITESKKAVEPKKKSKKAIEKAS
ncbi:MAG: hypothetical protein Q8K86_09550 [Candidatus Nanopelagicaceae bacterium]|nr:hypothetical protein [Candidatus Nanopelagicaceae bacterium]